MDAKDSYAEVGNNFRRFVEWREKIFAGYVTSIAALGVGFAQVASAGFRVGLLSASVLVSIVFWILDLRNRTLMAVCQRVGAELEKSTGGSFTALTKLRDTSRTRLTHGLAVNLLVAGVIGGAAGGLYLYVPRWFRMTDHAGAVVSTLAMIGAALLIFERVGDNFRSSERPPNSSIDPPSP